LRTAIGDACHAACVEAPLQAGTYWVWVGAADYANVACDSHYHLTISGYGCRVAVQSANWSRVKTLYR
jgi:hypothetical protein